MSQKPSVSFIICNYNGKEFLEPLFLSLRALEYPKESIELLLVDNGSTDDSASCMEKRFPEVRLLRNETNLGFARACNQGAEAAGGEWLAFINNDMRLEPDWLARLFEAIEGSGQDVACAGGKILSWDGKRIDFVGGALSFYGHAFQQDFGKETSAVPAGQAEEILFACGGAMLIRRSVFTEIGGFDNDYFAYFEDVDLGWRLWLLGHTVILAPGAIAYHRHFGTTRKFLESRHLFLCERNALFNIYKNYSDENLKRVFPAALLLLIARFFLHSSRRPESFLPVVASHEPSAPDMDEAGVRRMFRLWEEEGIRGAIDRGLLSIAVRELAKSGMRPVSEKGLAILSAACEFLSAPAELMKKREFVQSRRKRSDEEVFPLFRDPLRVLPDTPGMRKSFEGIAKVFGIPDIFRI